MSARSKVWITRAEPGASATAARIAAFGLEPLVAPVLTIRPLDRPIDLTDVGALAFTSANGVRAFAAASPRRDLAVFAVGDVTAEVARQAGFTDVTSADDNVAGLARLIVSVSPKGTVLHPGPVERAGDLAGALRRRGLDARTVDLYETVGLGALPETVKDAFKEREIAAILFHSPRAAEVAAPLLAGFDLSAVTLVGLSAACLKPLDRLGPATAIAAKAPREDALIDALVAALGNLARPR